VKSERAIDDRERFRSTQHRVMSRYNSDEKGGFGGLPLDLLSVIDVPFELVGKVSGACAMTEAGHVERCASTSRHTDSFKS
jgi:hypothetical protein